MPGALADEWLKLSLEPIGPHLWEGHPSAAADTVQLDGACRQCKVQRHALVMVIVLSNPETDAFRRPSTARHRPRPAGILELSWNMPWQCSFTVSYTECQCSPAVSLQVNTCLFTFIRPHGDIPLLGKSSLKPKQLYHGKTKGGMGVVLRSIQYHEILWNHMRNMNASNLMLLCI